jgi:hypothetical protein
VIDDPWAVRVEDRKAELARLQAIVNPTITAMRAVEEERVQPVPNQSWFAPCSSCGYRRECARWTGGASPAPTGSPSPAEV